MHAKAIDNFSCCSVACLYHALHALPLLCFPLFCCVLRLHLLLPPRSCCNIMHAHNLYFFFFKKYAFTFTSSDHVLLAVLALAARASREPGKICMHGMDSHDQ